MCTREKIFDFLAGFDIPLWYLALAQDFHDILARHYEKEPFVHVLPFGKTPQSRHVRGSNMTFIGVADDRKPGRAIIVSTLDNLTKGASGQAVQNMNVMLGFSETLGIDQPALSA